MKFISNTIPKPSLGVDYSGEVSQVVPDQSLSLEQILIRFTRGEPVPVGHETSEGIQDVDLEKLSKADLVDRFEYVEHLKSVRKQYEMQEAEKKKAEKLEAEKKAKAEEEKRIRIAARKLAAEKAPKAQ